jgi:hypothetical protein
LFDAVAATQALAENLGTLEKIRAFRLSWEFYEQQEPMRSGILNLLDTQTQRPYDLDHRKHIEDILRLPSIRLVRDALCEERTEKEIHEVWEQTRPAICAEVVALQTECKQYSTQW